MIYIWGLSSCDPGSTVTFELVNQTNEVVTVDYYDFDSTKAIHLVVPGQCRQILFQRSFIGYLDRFEQEDSMQLGHQVKIWKDTALLNLNLRDKSNWNYHRISHGAGWSSLVIK